MPRQGLVLDITQLDNDAFQPDPRLEIARILRDLACRVEYGIDEDFRLRDLNGNTVGQATLNLTGD